MPARPALRRSQESRSRETRDRILGATLDCILDKGLQDTSTVTVAERAGVSRGALLHHFPAKDTLLREALRSLLRGEIERMRAVTGDVAAGKLDFDTLIDRIWDQFSGPLYMISLEFVNAARTDPAIREALLDVGHEFNAAYLDVWERLVQSRLGAVTPRRRTAFVATLCLMRGMATQSVWRDDPAVFGEVIAFWKSALRDLRITTPADDGAWPR